VVLVAIAVAIALSSGGGGTTTSSSEALRASPGESQPVAPGGAAAGASVRHVERSAQLTIAAAADKLQQVGDGIGQVAEAHHGFVVSSSISTGADSARGGTFVLRVPSNQLEAVLGEIGKLGTVRARSESSQDMTEPYRGTARRLGNALLERSATRAKLRHVKGKPSENSVRAHLRALNAQISTLSGRMKNLRQRTVYSTVNVTLEQQQGGAGAVGSGPGRALHDALHTLSGALELAIRVLAVVLPLALLAALGWVAGGALRRRRREAALF
jgi:hypothetical protein